MSIYSLITFKSTENGEEIRHHGIHGMHWGVRRYQNPDGSLTAAGKSRYGSGDGKHSFNFKGGSGSSSGVSAGGGGGYVRNEEEDEEDKEVTELANKVAKELGWDDSESTDTLKDIAKKYKDNPNGSAFKMALAEHCFDEDDYAKRFKMFTGKDPTDKDMETFARADATKRKRRAEGRNDIHYERISTEDNLARAKATKEGKTYKRTAEQDNAMVKAISNNSGMKSEYIQKAVDFYNKHGADSPSFKRALADITEGDPEYLKKYYQTITGKQMSMDEAEKIENRTIESHTYRKAYADEKTRKNLARAKETKAKKDKETERYSDLGFNKDGSPYIKSAADKVGLALTDKNKSLGEKVDKVKEIVKEDRARKQKNKETEEKLKENADIYLDGKKVTDPDKIKEIKEGSKGLFNKEYKKEGTSYFNKGRENASATQYYSSTNKNKKEDDTFKVKSKSSRAIDALKAGGTITEKISNAMNELTKTEKSPAEWQKYSIEWNKAITSGKIPEDTDFATWYYNTYEK